jgi:hypothetical protein
MISIINDEITTRCINDGVPPEMPNSYEEITKEQL